jgi:diguanylate cyclase (GGDEF)-like protein
MHAEPRRPSPLSRVLNAPAAVLFGAAVGLWLLLVMRNWNLFATMAAFNAAHPTWFIEEDIVGLVALGIASTILLIRRSYELRREIARRRHSEDLAAHLARHDPLTGLPNRRVFQENAARIISELPPGGTVAALLIDLDGFKTTNDVHGHAVGDEVLCQVADRLLDLVADNGTVARLGGDEFVVVTKADLDKDALSRIADRIVLTLGEPILIQDLRISIGASVGISICPGDGDSVGTLLRAADLAMYRAKEAGRGAVRFFEQEMDATLREQAALRSELREAIGAGQIRPFYQPLIDLRTQDIDGFEVLARWQHPTRGLLEPDKFITLAENMKLITPMTLAMFRQVCADARDWPTQYRMALNISPVQLAEADLFDSIAAMMKEAGISISRLEVEITESSLIKDTQEAARIVDRLRAMGITVALDDFGTGYSSLYHLREIHFDKVKIDRSFVQNIGRDPRAASYVEAIICMGRSLHLQTTAEGIEDADVMAKLMELGCTYGQGYLFAKPMSGADVRRNLRLDAPLDRERPRPLMGLPSAA